MRLLLQTRRHGTVAVALQVTPGRFSSHPKGPLEEEGPPDSRR